MSHSSLCDRPLQRFAMCTQIVSECSVKVGCKSTAHHWGLLSVCRELQQGDAESCPVRGRPCTRRFASLRRQEMEVMLDGQ